MNRRLYRSSHDRVLAGVAGGMAETYDMDPAVVRIVWALLIIFTGGLFLVLYVVMALVVPLRPPGEPLPYADEPRHADEPAYADEPVYGPVDGTTQAGMPPAAAPPPRRRERRDTDNTGPLILGALLIIVGGLFLFRNYFNIDLGQLWPIAIIALGVLLIVGAFGRRERRA